MRGVSDFGNAEPGNGTTDLVVLIDIELNLEGECM